MIPAYLLQERKDGTEFKASIKAFRRDGGGKDDYKWTILKYLKMMDGKLIEIMTVMPPKRGIVSRLKTK